MTRTSARGTDHDQPSSVGASAMPGNRRRHGSV